MIVDVHLELVINNKRIDVQVEGECQRTFGGVQCHIRRVISNDGVNVYGAVAQDDIAPIEARLMCAYLSAKHPLGEPEAAV